MKNVVYVKPVVNTKQKPILLVGSYKVVDERLVEGADVEEEQPVHGGSLLGLSRIKGRLHERGNRHE